MLITQRQAIQKLRDATGLSEGWCVDQVKALATVKDGKRKKLHEAKLSELIRRTNDPNPIPTPKGVRPFSAKKIAKIRSYA